MAKESKEAAVKEEPKKKCGIVMPIAGSDGYSTTHWESVERIIKEASADAGFDANMVSYSDETSIIHSNIINNLYHNEIVVVDVSSRNPNVMFELGIRLAFDKPTIVIKDEFTPYTFDAGVIDHLPYPKGLDYYTILKFKKDLSQKIESTYKRSRESDYRSFLKNFSDLKITKAKLDEKEVSQTEYLIKIVEALQNDIKSMKPEAANKTAPKTFIASDFEIYKLWEQFMKSKSKQVGKSVELSDFRDFPKWVAQNFPYQYNSVNFHAFPIEKLISIIIDWDLPF